MTPTQHTSRFFKQHHFDFFLTILFIVSIVLTIIVYLLERNVGPINTPFEAVRWSIDTITTVGLGDVLPITPIGRFIGMILQIIGAVMFGLVIAVTSIYITRSHDDFQRTRLFERIDRLESELREVRKRIGFVVRTEVNKDLRHSTQRINTTNQPNQRTKSKKNNPKK